MIRINLLPHKKVKPVEKGVMRLWTVAIAVAVLLIGGMLVLYIMMSSQMGDIKDKKAAAEQEFAQLQNQLKQVSDYETKRKDFEQKLATIDQIQKTKIALTPVMLELNKLVDKDIWVDRLVIHDANIEINFKSLKRQSIQPFFETMQKSKMFSGLTLDSVEAFSAKLVGSNSFPFTVKGKIAGFENMARPMAKVAAPPAPKPKGKK